MKPDKLNLGCGLDFRRREDGWLNHDLMQRAGVDVVHDLNIRPWPWADNAFIRVDALSVLEHLELTLLESLDELWRIVAPGGEVRIKYPVYTSPFFHHDPTHRWAWSVQSIDFVDPTTKMGKSHRYYGARPWKIHNKRANERNCWVTLVPIKE